MNEFCGKLPRNFRRNTWRNLCRNDEVFVDSHEKIIRTMHNGPNRQFMRKKVFYLLLLTLDVWCLQRSCSELLISSIRWIGSCLGFNFEPNFLFEEFVAELFSKLLENVIIINFAKDILDVTLVLSLVCIKNKLFCYFFLLSVLRECGLQKCCRGRNDTHICWT